MFAINMILMLLPALLVTVVPILLLLLVGDWLRDEYKQAHNGGGG